MGFWKKLWGRCADAVAVCEMSDPAADERKIGPPHAQSGQQQQPDVHHGL